MNYIIPCLFTYSICLAFSLPGVTQSTSGKRIYVNASAQSGSEADGRTWLTAYTDLQQALSNSSTGDSIWVAEGHYLPTQDQDRNKSFVVPTGVRLFGGFKGSEKHLRERNSFSRQSVLSGELGDLAINWDNSIHVVTLVNPDTTNLLDGFTIEKGYAVDKSSSDISKKSGGGLWIQSNQKQAKIRLKNCLFRDNIVSYGGGGIAVIENGLNTINHLEIEDCLFQRNFSYSGGALHCEFFNSGSSLSIYRSEFELNRSTGFGAAVRHLFAGSLQILGCKFDRNQNDDTGIIRSDNTDGKINIQGCAFNADYSVGGGLIDIYFIGNSSASNNKIIKINIIENTFINILGGMDVGAFFFSEYSENSKIQILIEDCLIQNSRNSLGANGVKIEKTTASSSIECLINRCIFNENSISGKLFGIVNFINYAADGKVLVGQINNCIFRKNTGPAIFASQYKNGQTDIKILNSTFLGNTRETLLSDRRESNAQINWTIQNTIFYGSPAPLSSIFQNTNQANLTRFRFNHCLFSSPACSTTGDTTGCGLGNIFGQYPKFMDSTRVSGLKLALGSVAINAGRWYPELTALDLAGQPRVQDCKVDIGAYESPSLLSPNDTLAVKVQIRSSPGSQPLGAIGIQQISGGMPPYRIRWENGDSARVRNALPPGQYTLTLTDQLGCYKIYTYTVPVTTALNSIRTQSTQIQLVPNPGHLGQAFKLHYQGMDPGQWQLQVLDLSGRVLLRQGYTLQAEGSLELPQQPGFPAGLYVLSLSKNEMRVSTKWVVLK
jgi:hypothetical protein